MSDRSSMFRIHASLVGLGLALACGAPEQPAAPAAETPAAAAEPAPPPQAAAVDYSTEAKELFDLRCTVCHGALGAGDGPGSAALNPMPRNFRDASWQESITDEQITQAVLYGGAAVGKSPAMPGNPDLASKEELVAALVQHVRSLKR